MKNSYTKICFQCLELDIFVWLLVTSNEVISYVTSGGLVSIHAKNYINRLNFSVKVTQIDDLFISVCVCVCVC